MKSRIIAVLVGLILITASAVAQTVNRLSVPDITAGRGSTVSLPVVMENAAEVVAVQFTLEMPEGATLYPQQVVKSGRLEKHTVSGREVSHGKYTFIIMSADNEPISGYAGQLFTIPLRIGESLNEGHSYPMAISEAVMSLQSGGDVLEEATAGTITVSRSTDFIVKSVSIEQTSASPGEEITVSWSVSNNGELDAKSGWHEQLLLVSFDGSEERLIGTVYNESTLLQAGSTVQRSATVMLPQLPGIDGDVRVRVKLVPNGGSGERPEAQGNNSADSQTLLSLAKRLVLQMPAQVMENGGQTVECKLMRTGSWKNEETFSLSTDGDSRISLPSTITIPARQSGAVFSLSITDNELLDSKSIVVITAEGSGYPVAQASLVIEDNEYPDLTVTASKTEITEGETFQLTVTTSRVSAQAIEVTLTSEHPQRFSYPRQVIIPAGETSATVEVTAVNDDLPGEELSSAFMASASGYNKGEAIVLLQDDDMPVLELMLTPNKVQEGAGPVSIAAVLRRTTNKDSRITVRLSDDSNGGLYFSTRELVLAKGVEEAVFNFGPVDNADVDGSRTYTINAAVWLSSCSCSAAGQSAGSVSAQLEVLDDDGPALTLTSTLSTIMEGGQALLTVGRNTLSSLDQPLTVTLTSDYDENLTYEHTVIIPAGQQTVQVEITSNNNDVSEDSHTVVFTAQADGYSAATCWLMVTDQTLPDAIITSISVAETEIKAAAVLDVSITIANHGQASLPAGVNVSVYVYGNSSAIGTSITSEPLEPGASTTLTVGTTMPSKPGRVYLYAVVNDLLVMPELYFGNNTSTYVAVQLLPRLTTTVVTDKTIYKQGEAVAINGTLTDVHAKTEVEVYAVCNSIRQAILVTTDEQGCFNASWQPFEGLMGHALIGACHPGEEVRIGQTSVEIMGLNLATNGYMTCQTWVGETYTGTIDLHNPDSVAQTISSVEVVQKPSHCNVDFHYPATIEAGDTVGVDFSLIGETPSEGNDWEKIIIRIMTFEGASIEHTLYYYCRSALGKLVASQNQINTTVTMGTTRNYPVTVTNQGKGATGQISLSLPNVGWLTTATPNKIPSLEFGDSATIVLSFTPTNDMALNIPVTGTIGLNCENGSGQVISFNIEPVSDLTGRLTVTVIDEYTSYLEDKPGVADAKVTLRHPVSGAIIAEGVTGNDGLFIVDLPEGYYRIDVEAQKHSSYTNYVLIDPGRELRHEVFVSYQAITYNMTVEETEVEDQYELNITADYETNVPKPVIIISLPKQKPMPGVPFPIVVTNKGLIALNQVNIQAVISQEYSFEIIGNTMLDELGPQQSHVVYAVIRGNTTSDSSNSNMSGSGYNNLELPDVDNVYNNEIYEWWEIDCIIAYVVVEGFYICGPDWKWHFIPLQEHAYLFNCFNHDSSGGWNGEVPPALGWNPPGSGGDGDSVVPGSIPVSNYECNPCIDMMIEPLIDCIVGIGSNAIPFMSGIAAIATDCTSLKYDPITGEPHFTYSSNAYCARGFLGAAISVASSKLSLAFSIATCLHSVWSVIKCFMTKPENQARGFGQSRTSDLDWLYDCHELMITEMQAAKDFLIEYFGNEQWLDCNVEELDALVAYITANPDCLTFTVSELQSLKPSGISDGVLSLFVERVNNTNLYDQGLIEASNNMVNASTIDSYWNIIKNCESRAVAMGYATTADLFEAALSPTEALLTSSTSHVCASVQFAIKQTMTLTRPAYRATLEVYNGHDETAMQNVRLNLQLKADDSTFATTKEFQVNVDILDGFEGELNLDSGWTLNAQQTGTATILIIPTKYAAPIESKIYTLSGSLIYIDPFTETEITRPILPQQLVVNPIPDLELTYLMQRDVYGDDPLTEDKVEPMKPAELALIINNKGNGNATNMRIITEQPRIVDNEKGLLIELNIDSTQVNGLPAMLSFGDAVPNEFGTVPAQSQSYAQWWLHSTLLGHFTSYEVETTHVTSFGNEYLSIIDTLSIHEMIHGFTTLANVQSSMSNGKRGWLVNDIVDADDMPDAVYFADATKQPLIIANQIGLQRNAQSEYLLTVTPNQSGWNYGSLVDPTRGMQTIAKIVRQNDGAELPNDNVWQTDRTLRDGKDWLYEYRLHFVDEFASQTAQTYLLTFEPVPETVLEVASIGVVPAEGEIAEEPIETLTVTFNKAIDASTFTADDITFNVQGVKQDASQIGISTQDNRNFTLDMGGMNDMLPNGYYTMSVQTADITDVEGYQGKNGKQVGWIMFRGGLVQLQTSAYPAMSGTVSRRQSDAAGARETEPSDGNDDAVAYGSVVTLEATPATGYKFLNWTLNGKVVSTDEAFETTALGDMNVVANFTKKNYMVNIGVEGVGGTTEGTATGIYEHGTPISVTAIPDEDYILQGWTVNGEPAGGSNSELTLVADQALDIQATFMQEYFRQSMTMARGWNWISAYLSEPLPVTELSRYANRILSQTDELINDPEYGMVGGLTELTAGQAYKIEAVSRSSNSFRGHLYDTTTKPITLHQGWNWIAFPFMERGPVTMVTNAEEGDFITSQTGFAEYADGTWAGTLDMFTPGSGYLYKSVESKQLAFDPTMTVSQSRSWGARTPTVTEQDIDIHRYPSTMNVTADIFRDGAALDGNGYTIYALVGDELRGISQCVDGHHYLTVYGEAATEISFVIENAETGESFEAGETLTFRSDVVGSRKSPFAFNMGNATGIDSFDGNTRMTVYTLEGILVSRDATLKMLRRLPKGVYIVNGQKRYVK